PVARRLRAPRERVVERVEVRAHRDRGALRVVRAVVGDHVAQESGGRLDRGAVPDPPGVPELALHASVGRDVAWALANRLRVGGDAKTGTERGVDALAEVEVEIPGLQVLEHVRDVHAGAVPEVVARAEVDVPERLEVRDPSRPHPGALRRGEPE